MKTSNKLYLSDISFDKPLKTFDRPSVSFEKERRSPGEVFSRDDLEWAYEQGAKSIDEATSKIADNKRATEVRQ